MEHDPLQIAGFMTVQLNSGVTIMSSVAVMKATYRELLAGRPDAERDRAYVEQRSGEVQQLFGCRIYVVKPERRWSGNLRTEHLPVVEIAALFESWGKEEEDMRRLSIMWYQDTPCPPMSEGNRGVIAAIDWTALAERYEL